MLRLEGALILSIASRTTCLAQLRFASLAAFATEHTFVFSLRPARPCSHSILVPTGGVPNTAARDSRIVGTISRPFCLLDSP